ncbi:tRNA (adenosine(37)-N6)-dimethylallyltransferase MiaA [Alkalilacustris brevis]|uniref:tRNA (adenosine(37)-N6)-dimethylallyltransferase MiaA n=1 Tax=Alkalilacustris brevis TaxID=2026338 RepID=UPI000E0E06FC|nr:tRNA (adenosine(37)-N6)-dimethylallyltransferase MiaA [Alkalilacustris brevis]
MKRPAPRQPANDADAAPLGDSAEAARAFARTLAPGQHVLIAGPTASGKSALALAIAEAAGGIVVNADALQVYECWRILTARPTPEDMARAPHRLYGHVACDAPYSVGHWLREVADLLQGGRRLIVTGGTGLYFTALTEGLAEIPATPPEIRAEAQARLNREGAQALAAELDPETRARTDTQNPARVMRAWEVLRATGRGLAAFQAETPPPLLPAGTAERLLFTPDPAWLARRIDRRFEAMMAAGALEEVRAQLPRWTPAHPSSRAIGAAELVAHLHGEIPLDAAIAQAKTATRQYAKRQRTWFRNRLKGWRPVQPG